MTPRKSFPCPKKQPPGSKTAGIDHNPEKSPPLAPPITPSKLSNTPSLRQATSGRYHPVLSYQNVKWCIFRLPRWCTFNLPKTVNRRARKLQNSEPQVNQGARGDWHGQRKRTIVSFVMPEMVKVVDTPYPKREAGWLLELLFTQQGGYTPAEA